MIFASVFKLRSCLPALFLIGAPVIANAQSGTGWEEQAAEAQAASQIVISEAGSGQLPLATDTDAGGTAFRTVCDAKSVVGVSSTGAEVDDLMNWMTSTPTVMMTYVMSLSPEEQQAFPYARYSTEIGMCLDASILLAGAVTRSSLDMLEENPSWRNDSYRMDGLKQMSGGFTEMVGGIALMVSQLEMNDPWKTARYDTVIQELPSFLGIMTAQNCRSLRSDFEALATPEEVQTPSSQYNQIINLLTCDSL